MGTTTYKNKTTKNDVNAKMQELNDILNNSWDGIAIIDELGNFVFTNRAFSPILNYEKSELLKLNFVNLVSEETRDTIKFALIKAKKLGTLRNIKITCVRKDKQKVFLESSLALMGNGKYFVLNARDITEHVSKDEIINEYVLSCQVDLDGNITEVSEALQKLLKFEKNELLGNNHIIIRNRQYSELEFRRILEGSSKEENLNYEFINLTKDKKELLFDTKIKPIFNKYGDKIGYILICFDISYKAQLQHIVNEYGGSMSEEETNEINGILGSVSNAWIEPLKNINSKIKAIQDSNYDVAKVKANIDAISKMSKNLTKNVTNIKNTFERKSEKKILNVSTVVANIINLLEKTNNRHQVDLIKELESVPEIYSDEESIKDVILAIITNSLEAFKRNSTKKPIIDMSVNVQNKKEILIQIIDNGGGIPDDIMKNVFNPYFSTKKDPTKGLGLYTAKTIVEKNLEGKLLLEGNNEMTVASIILPI